MTKTVVAIYNSMNEVQNAKNQLLNNGFSSNDIDISSGNAYPANSDSEESGVSRFFRNLFGNNDDKRERYLKVAEQNYLITVHAHSDEEAQKATKLLDDYGAIDVDENYQKNFFGRKDKDYYDARNETLAATDSGYKNSNENYEHTHGNYSRADENLESTGEGYLARNNKVDDKNEEYDAREKRNDNLVENNKTIPIIEENITIGKKEVGTGGVRIRSRIVEKPIEENLRLREEHIHVERNKVDRQATEDELKNFKNQTVELTANREIPDVQKTSKVVEEVSLGKQVNHRDEIVRDKVRTTQVDVEDINSDDNVKHPKL